MHTAQLMPLPSHEPHHHLPHHHLLPRLNPDWFYLYQVVVENGPLNSCNSSSSSSRKTRLQYVWNVRLVRLKDSIHYGTGKQHISSSRTHKQTTTFHMPYVHMLTTVVEHTTFACRYIRRDIMCKHDVMNIQHA